MTGDIVKGRGNSGIAMAITTTIRAVAAGCREIITHTAIVTTGNIAGHRLGIGGSETIQLIQRGARTARVGIIAGINKTKKAAVGQPFRCPS